MDESSLGGFPSVMKSKRASTGQLRAARLPQAKRSAHRRPRPSEEERLPLHVALMMDSTISAN
eukprot:5340529-Prymnesium_polylepis.1